MDKILIDTDVILDFFFDRQPFSEYAAKILALCEAKAIEGFVSPVIISNVYYLLRKTSGHSKVAGKLSQLLTIIDIVDMDKDVVWQALHSKFNDFEDALQNFAAVRQGAIEIIITRNVKDFKNSELGVYSPQDYLETLIARQ